MPSSGLPCRAFVVIAAFALLGCQSRAEKEAAKKLAAIEAFVPSVPTGDPKEFVRSTVGYADKLKALEAKLPELRSPAGTPAAVKLGPAVAWIEAARAEHDAIEGAFRAEIGPLEKDAHADLSKAVIGGATRPASEMPEALATSRVKPIVLWHGTGNERGFDEDHQNLPVPGRRAIDASSRFIVGFVQRMDGEGVTFVTEKVTAERKVAFVALYEMPSKRRLGLFTVQGETARLPNPIPLAGTVLPGEKPAIIEHLLRAP